MKNKEGGISPTQQSIMNVDKKFDQFMVKMDQFMLKVEKNFQQVDQKFEKIDQNFQEIGENFKKVFAAIQRNEDNIGRNTGAINRLEAKTEYRFAILNEKIEEIRDMIINIDKKSSEDISAVMMDQDTLKKRIDVLEKHTLPT